MKQKPQNEAERNEHTRQIGIRLPVSLLARLEVIAHREANGVSAVRRRLLSAALERENKVE
jgi:hypothetical protein